jgi:hypothetical protein
MNINRIKEKTWIDNKYIPEIPKKVLGYLNN